MTASRKPAPELPIMLFATQADWADWLAANHAAAAGVWLRLAKKDAELRSVSYAAALDVALCYGWIDGQKRSYDAESWLQKFTRRGARSLWSKINRDKADALIAAGQMQPPGLAAIDTARADGRWDAAYDGGATSTVPADLQAALDANPQAAAFFATINRTNRYAILFRIQTAKTAATRLKRIQQFVAMLANGDLLYP